MSQINSYNICFLGRTGNGKSSLINELWGTHFNTDPLVSCTKELQSVTTLCDSIASYEAITVYDTPGIGEYSSSSKYDRYYEHAVSCADCIVLVTTFDRTDAPAQRLLLRLKKFVKDEKKVKFVIALNHIDSRIIADTDNTYEPWDVEKDEPSEHCWKNIYARKKIIYERFDNKFLPFTIIPVCALRKYGIDNLKREISLKNKAEYDSLSREL